MAEGGVQPRTLSAGRVEAAGSARALTRENSVPGQLTRKGMSSLSCGSARPPPAASRRPQRTKTSGPQGIGLRGPPPPSSILRRRALRAAAATSGAHSAGGGGEAEEEAEEAAGLQAPGREQGTNRRHVSFRRARERRPRTAGTGRRFRGGRRGHIRGLRAAAYGSRDGCRRGARAFLSACTAWGPCRSRVRRLCPASVLGDGSAPGVGESFRHSRDPGSGKWSVQGADVFMGTSPASGRRVLRRSARPPRRPFPAVLPRPWRRRPSSGH